MGSFERKAVRRVPIMSSSGVSVLSTDWSERSFDLVADLFGP